MFVPPAWTVWTGCQACSAILSGHLGCGKQLLLLLPAVAAAAATS
jgi:hypothetical protein